MKETMKAYIKNLKISECNQCAEVRALQAVNNRNINVAPLFWQGEGKINIPLVIMGINPSVVGTTNEPQREVDFEQYFNYYQNRGESEKESVILARAGGFLRRIPRNYWTRCHKLAEHLVGNGIERWKDYILMEAIHCFYNKATDLTAAQAKSVAKKCFNCHTKKMLMTLKPRMIVLFGNAPYQLLADAGYLKNTPLDNYKHGFLCIDKLRTPVLRHPHPAGFNPGEFYRPKEYESFKLYCSNFVYGN